eukprot:4979923-Lingulodinium_polyedra.AAC.1
MPMKTCEELFHGVPTASAAPASDVASCSFYALRRFLPTVADLMAFRGAAAQSIGNWQDIPKA